MGEYFKMASTLCMDPPVGGFSFENCQRNANLANLGFKAPKAVKTGTTIAGIIYKDGVILGADTRATNDTVVADKNCSKIHYIAPNIYCCGAGTAADTEMTTNMIASQLELHRLNTGREPAYAQPTVCSSSSSSDTRVTSVQPLCWAEWTVMVLVLCPSILTALRTAFHM